MNPRDEVSAGDLIIVARAVRTRGLKGELVAELLTDFPDRFESVTRLVGVAPGGEREEFELEDYWFQNDRLIIRLRNYDTVEAANTLVGFEFGLPEKEQVQLPADEFYEWQLAGCEVVNADGMVIGKVRDVMRTGGVQLLVVDDGAQHEHLIPMARDIVIDVNLPARKILIDPPEGLLDL